jgi:hypothetical protein
LSEKYPEVPRILLYGNDDFKIKPKETDRRKQAYFAFSVRKGGVRLYS